MTVLSKVVVTGVVALSGCAPGAVGPPRASERFDPQAVETVDGRVLGVDRVPIQDQLAYSVHLTLGQAEGGPVSVALGPGWYLSRQGLSFSPRDVVEVRGVRVEHEGKTSIVAEQVKKGGKVVLLRDERGRPLWGAPAAPSH
jgi:hypothetical protein